MSNERPDRCETCRFWVQKQENGEPLDWGSCQRNPPTINLGPVLALVLNLRDISRESRRYSDDPATPFDDVSYPGKSGNRLPVGVSPNDSSTEGVWPESYGDDWCGEWREKLSRRPAADAVIIGGTPVGLDEPIDGDQVPGLSSRVTNLLWTAAAADGQSPPGGRGFTLRWLCSKSRDGLMENRNFGDTSAREVEAWLRGLGLSLRQD
jgi:hypothetical protein